MIHFELSDPASAVRLLGVQPVGGRIGPFCALGLSPSPMTSSQIEAALQRQLDRLQQHTESDTSAAGRLRADLHRAAELLTNSKNQPAWIAAERRVWDEVHGQKAPAAVVDEPEVAVRRRVGDPLLARMLVIGSVAVVALLGLAIASILFVSTPPSGGTGSGAPGGAGAGNARVTSQEAAASPSAGDGQLAGATSQAATASDGDTSAAPTGTANRTPSTTKVTDAAASGPSLSRARSEFVDPALVIRELRAASETARSDLDKAMLDFERAFNSAGDWWCRYDTSQVRAASDAVVEFVYRTTSRRAVFDQVMNLIREPLGALQSSQGLADVVIWRAAWSGGVLARLYRERDFPIEVLTTVARSLEAALGEARPARAADSTFEAGAAAVFRLLPAAILAGKAQRFGSSDPQGDGLSDAALARWVEGVSLFTRGDDIERERYLVGALGWILTDAPEPEADSRVFRAINLLAAEIKWRRGGPARARLLEWFRDPRITSSDLRVVTGALATRSGAEGVDSTMVLSMTARADDRALLRIAYAKAWGLAEASARADATRSWESYAKQALAHPLQADDPAALAALAASLSRVSTGAAMIWRGAEGEPTPFEAPDVAGSGEEDSVTPAVPSSTQIFRVSGGAGAATGDGQDGIWTRDYLGERRSIPGREQRLEDLAQRGRPIGPIDAGLLAQAACSESPWKVREAAQRVLLLFAEEPALVSAMLDFLPLAPRTNDVSRLYADVAGVRLPSASDPQWELEARRAMLSRLMSMITVEGVHGRIEGAASRIAAAYLGAVGRELDSPGADIAADGALSGISELFDSAHADAASFPVSAGMSLNLEQIDRRHRQRMQQAVGPVQKFAAAQSGLLEVLGFVTAQERPNVQTRVVQILNDAAAERRKASHVFEQVVVNERALIRVWMFRLGLSEETP